MGSMTAGTRMRLAHRFEDLLPNSTDPAKGRLRAKLVNLLNSQGEIIPAASTPLGKLWNLVNSANSSIDECEDVIKLDAALTSRMFRVANSAAYNAKATDIAEALRFIGFKSLREMVFNATVLQQFSTLKVPAGWDVFWLRNIFIARLSDRIATTYFQTDGSEYLAGLIHDIGWLFLATHFEAEFAAIITSDKPIVDAEKEVLPFSHANIAAAIAARSAMPLKAVDGIAYHHKQMLMTQSTLVAPNQNPLFLGIILAVCDRVADGCQLDLFGKPAPTPEELAESPEIVWLKGYGKKLELETLAAEELVKSEEIFTAFFTEPAKV
ncbi:MAG TPA: HDOD domain-containing protein [Candidatus Methylacidiphilales bacterium]|nr:HDOD domain-containing protein [Candidatus Methylacidiphilales bacterium]